MGFKRISTPDMWSVVADVGILRGDDLDVMKELLRRIDIIEGVSADYIGERIKIDFYPCHFISDVKHLRVTGQS